MQPAALFLRGTKVLFKPRRTSDIMRCADGRCLGLIVDVPGASNHVMLTVFSATGHTQPALEVPLLAPDDPEPVSGYWCKVL